MDATIVLPQTTKGYTEYELTGNKLLRVYVDEHALSPDTEENKDDFIVSVGTILEVEREGFAVADVAQFIIDDPHGLSHLDKFYIYTLYTSLYDDSDGITVTLDENAEWVKATGYVFIRKERNIEALGIEGKLDLNSGREVAKTLLDKWNQYLAGYVYRFGIFESKLCSACGHKHTTLLASENSFNNFIGDYNPRTNGMLDLVQQIDPSVHIITEESRDRYVKIYAAVQGARREESQLGIIDVSTAISTLRHNSQGVDMYHYLCFAESKDVIDGILCSGYAWGASQIQYCLDIEGTSTKKSIELFLSFKTKLINVIAEVLNINS